MGGRASSSLVALMSATVCLCWCSLLLTLHRIRVFFGTSTAHAFLGGRRFLLLDYFRLSRIGFFRFFRHRFGSEGQLGLLRRSWLRIARLAEELSTPGRGCRN